jgi:hypothetical protein
VDPAPAAGAASPAARVRPSRPRRTPPGADRRRALRRSLCLVQVPHPERWRVVSRDEADRALADVPGPDAPGDDARWAAVAAALQAVGRALAAGAYSRDPDEPDVARVPVDVGVLDRRGRRMVRAWFAGERGAGESCPRPCGARPRGCLARAWDALPCALLPVEVAAPASYASS